MLRYITLLAATLSAIGSGRAYSQSLDQSASSDMVGRWERPAVSIDDTGELIEFTAQGTIRVAAGSLVHGTWRANGFLLTHASAAPPDTVTVRVSIRADTMVQFPMLSGDSVLLTRHDGREGPSPIGAWSVTTPSGEESLVEYRTDGTFRLWMPFDQEPVSYSVSADTLQVTGGKLAGRYHWSIVDGTLQLRWLGLGERPVIQLRRAGADHMRNEVPGQR